MVIPVEDILHLILMFFFYSFLGWCIEVVLKYIQLHRFVNRGFYSGPVCPIYGSGAVMITLAVQLLSPLESSVGTTFVVSFLLCGALEYFTSLVMEKRFHARWWDYSQKPMNLHGRVWIGNLILFGLGGIAIVHIVNPVLTDILMRFPMTWKKIAAVGLLLIFAADYVLTHFMMKLVKTGVETSTADSTEALNKEIRLLLSDRNVFYRRFADAYPDVIYRTERIKSRLDAIREETDRIRAEAERQLSDQKQKIISRAEPSMLIRISIMDKQERLIAMLYDEASATPEMREMKKEIDRDRHRLESRPLSKIVNPNK